MVADSSRKILIVDDDPSIIRTMTEALEPLGYEIQSAPDGNQGLACIEFFKPQLVILDLMMPKRSGLLVLEGMREIDQYIPAIMVTGNDGNRHRHYAEILGVDAYLTKPIRVELLVRTVKRVLEETESAAAADG
ncbi:MAG: response regulator [Pirellulaceae bacterium]